MTFAAAAFNDEYGPVWYEGISTLDHPEVVIGGYVVDSYVSPARWVNASGSRDTLVD